MSKEIMQQALDALLHMCNTTKAQNDYNAKIVDKALAAIESALAQPDQTPVAWMSIFKKDSAFDKFRFTQSDTYPTPVYTAPPKREWVGLHLDDIPETFVGDWSFLEGARWAEAKLKEKNGA